MVLSAKEEDFNNYASTVDVSLNKTTTKNQFFNGCILPNKWVLGFILYSLAFNMSVAQQGNNANDKRDSLIKNITLTDSTVLDRLSKVENEIARQKKRESHFMVVGLATMGFVLTSNTISQSGVHSTTQTNSFPDADRFEISPMLLWRHGKNLLIEFEPSWNGNSLGVNWGDISYFVKPGFIVRAGYLVLPFGIYNKRLAAGWINKLGSDPVGIADSPPSSDFGIEVEGGLPLGSMKWSYDISLTNGMQLLKDGTLQNAGLVDNNKNKTVTGRLSLLPFSNSSLELGVSGMYGKVGDANSNQTAAISTMYAFDINYVKKLGPMLINAKGQYNQVNISSVTYKNPIDSSAYSFTNNSSSYFGQLSIRPITAPGILKNFELAGRYVNYTTPAMSSWGAITNEYNVALDYWFTWRSVLKLVYESRDVKNNTPAKLGGAPGDWNRINNFIIQYSVQF